MNRILDLFNRDAANKNKSYISSVSPNTQEELASAIRYGNHIMGGNNVVNSDEMADDYLQPNNDLIANNNNLVRNDNLTSTSDLTVEIMAGSPEKEIVGDGKVEELKEQYQKGTFNPYDFQNVLRFANPEDDKNDIGTENTKYAEDESTTRTFLENTQCGLTDNEKISFINIFTVWTGIEYDDHTEKEIVNELNNVRAFFKNDLTKLLDLKGVLAEINEVLFMEELDRFTEQELMAYAIMFHIDLQPLDDMREVLEVKYGDIAARDGVKNDELLRTSETNLKIYLKTLKSVILEYRVWMIDRIRYWRWIEEVLLGRVSSNLTGFTTPLIDYPGVPIFNKFRSSSEILSRGISNYYLRVGEAKRENLVEKFKFFDLYHLAGVLALGYSNDVKFTTNTGYDDLADMVISMLDKIKPDPRHLLTPLAIFTIYNVELGEVVCNLYRYQEYDDEILNLACSHAGIPTIRNTIVDDPDTETYYDGIPSTYIRRDPKPQYVLVEELISQYLSPQFYSGIEQHRDYMGAITSFKTLSGDRILNAEESDIIFYGIGDGMSSYRIYTPRELAEVFIGTKEFIDPYSIKENPLYPDTWTRFSLQSIQRLLRIVIPRLRHKSKHPEGIKEIQQTSNVVNLVKRVNLIEPLENLPETNEERAIDEEEKKEEAIIREVDKVDIGETDTNRSDVNSGDVGVDEGRDRGDLGDLENIIMINMSRLDTNDPETIDEYIKPRGKQERIINEMKRSLEEIRSPLSAFLAYIFTMGMQFSDWADSMIQIDDIAIDAAITDDYTWKYFDPESTSNLNEKIFRMLTTEYEKYVHVIGETSPYTNMSPYDKMDLTVGEMSDYEEARRIDLNMVSTKDFTDHVKSLRLVKYYNGAYRIDWNDELATVNGHIYRMIKANNLSYYQHLTASGNWLMSTANYYSVIFFDYAIGDIELGVVGEPIHEYDYTTDI